MGSNLGVIVGAVVVLICLGLVVLMVVSEWATPPSTEGRASSPSSPSVRSARPARSGAKKKAAPKAKKRKK